MSPAQPTSPSESPTESKSPYARRDLNLAIESVIDASREASSKASLVKTLLEVVASCSGAMHAVLVSRVGASAVEHQVTANETRADFWDVTVRGMARDVLAENAPLARFFRAVESSVHLALIGIPFRSASGDVQGSLALVVPCESTAAAPRIVDEIEALVSVTLSSMDAVGSGTGVPSGAGMDAAVAALQKAATFSSVIELAFAVTNKLKSRKGLEEVAFGRVNGPNVEVLSIAGLDEIKRGSAGVGLLSAAMAECADLSRVCLSQSSKEDASPSVGVAPPLHRQWSDAYGTAAVASIPLFAEDEVAAVLCVRMADGLTFREEDLEELQRLVAPYAPTLRFIEAARRSLPQHLVETVTGAARGLVAPDTLGRKVAGALACLLGLWALFGSVPRHIRAQATIVPRQQYHVGAPLSAALEEVLVAPGDHVKAGQPLARFETRELVLEEARLAADLQLHTLSIRAALAVGAASDLGIAQAKKRSAEVALELVRAQIERSTLVAAVDGTVLNGDLRDRVGDTFSRGEPLFVVGSMDEWLLEIRVDESDILDVETGMAGEFAALSRPEESHAFHIERIRPSAVNADGGNKFVLEATAELDPEWMRSGMEGFAKIRAGRRNPIASVFGDAWNAVRVRFWL